LSSTPRINNTFSPACDPTVAPVIGCVEPIHIFDLVPHSSVFILGTSAGGSVATIVFQIGDVLVRRQELSISLFIAEAAWVSATSFLPRTKSEPKFEVFGVHVGRGSSDEVLERLALARAKASRILLKTAGAISYGILPAIIENKMIIAACL